MQAGNFELQENQGVALTDYVIQEAKEKCFEIEIKTLKQFEREKASIVESEKQQILEEFENKLKTKQQERRIHHSSLINKHRLMKLEARNIAMNKMFGATQYQIYQKIIKDEAFYKELLKKLIVQGMIKLMEKKVIIKCLKRDEALVASLANECKHIFADLTKKQIGEEYQVEIVIDKNRYLEFREPKDNSSVSLQDYKKIGSEVISKNEEDKKCFGGILLQNVNGTITCKNTLDIRIDLCFQDSLPIIRQQLFLGESSQL